MTELAASQEYSEGRGRAHVRSRYNARCPMTILVSMVLGGAIYTLMGLFWGAVLLTVALPFAAAFGLRRLLVGSHTGMPRGTQGRHGRHAYQAH